MTKVTIYYAIFKTGSEALSDERATLEWYLTRNAATEAENANSDWDFSSVGSVQTYEGSDIFVQAQLNEP